MSPHAIEARRQAAWRERDAFRTPPSLEEPAAPLHQALRAVHLGEHPHRPRPQLLDRRRLRPLPPRARRRGAVRLRLRRLRPARRARRDRRRRVAERLGEALRRAHDRPAASASASPSTGSARSSAPTRSCTAGRSGCSCTLLDAGLIYRGTGNVDWCDTCQTTLATIQVEDGALLALPRPGAADRAAAVVPAHQRLRAGERPPPGRARRKRHLGRGLARQPALRARPRRRRRGRPRRRRRRRR